MSTITFTSAHLKKLLQLNFYNFSENKFMVFGIRGALPAGLEFSILKEAHTIEASEPNYLTPHCCIGIWNPTDGKIALFPGSTVPNLKYIKKQQQGLARANCMMSGYYSYYEKGFHYPRPESAHKALRLATNIALRRSTDDLNYSNTDPVEVGNPSDNIHAAYCNEINGGYSSAGCQVIVGQPKCAARGTNSENTAYWKSFYDIIYGQADQLKFDYALFRFADAEAVALYSAHPMQTRLRFGSKGNTVTSLQQKLTAAGYYHTSIDGDFGRNTLRAVLEYQTAKFGLAEADGVVGNKTGGGLGLVLPMI
jgi:hypothetical protein